MEEFLLSAPFTNSFSNVNSEFFTVRYVDRKGLIFTGIVKAVNIDHYEVFIKEKGVIIHCTRESNGQLSCILNSKHNPAWVDGISREVERTVSQSNPLAGLIVWTSALKFSCHSTCPHPLRMLFDLLPPFVNYHCHIFLKPILFLVRRHIFSLDNALIYLFLF